MEERNKINKSLTLSLYSENIRVFKPLKYFQKHFIVDVKYARKKNHNSIYFTSTRDQAEMRGLWPRRSVPWLVRICRRKLWQRVRNPLNSGNCLEAKLHMRVISGNEAKHQIKDLQIDSTCGPVLRNPLVFPCDSLQTTADRSGPPATPVWMLQ